MTGTQRQRFTASVFSAKCRDSWAGHSCQSVLSIPVYPESVKLAEVLTCCGPLSYPSRAVQAKVGRFLCEKEMLFHSIHP